MYRYFTENANKFFLRAIVTLNMKKKIKGRV